MKKFNFSLQKLQNWRQIVFENEEARLAALLSERNLVLRQREDLDREEEIAALALYASTSVYSEDLAALSRFREFVRSEGARLEAARKRLEASIDAQRRQVLESRKELDVLRNVRDRRLNEWRREADKEQEQMVAELVIARWSCGTR